MRAISSTWLSENPLDIFKTSTTTITKHISNAQNNDNVYNDNCNGTALIDDIQSHAQTGVLQKLKNTFSQIKDKNNTTNITPPHAMSVALASTTRMSDSSAGRTKKNHCTDKCNCGDSGIHIDNNDLVPESDSTEIDTSPSFDFNVRRTNSTKVQSSVSSTLVKARALRKNECEERIYSKPLPQRSCSEPNGLNRLNTNG